MKKALVNYSSLILGWASALGVVFLSGCAVQPERAPSAIPAAPTASAQVNGASDEDSLPPPLGIAEGPRIKRVPKSGLHEPVSIEPPLAAIAEPSPAESIPTEDAGIVEPGELVLEDADLWARIRNGFGLGTHDDPRVRSAMAWFSRHPRFVERTAAQAEPYLYYIVNEVEQRGMPSEIALLPVIESAFQPLAYSAGRAAGLWQFQPDTGRRFGLKLNWWYDGRRDVVASTQAALDYLQYLHDTFNNDWLLALAAYNSGEGTVMRAIRENQRKGKPTDFWSLRLPRETEEYVPRLLAISAIVAAPAEQGVELKSIANEYSITPVEVDSQLDLAIAAKLAKMSVDALHRLNPAFNRWATDPDGPHLLLLPTDKAADFAIGLAALPPEQRVRWMTHRVRRGETLKQLAARYHATPHVLSRLNRLTDNKLRAGTELSVPITSGAVPLDPSHPVQKELSAQSHTVARGENLWGIARRYGVSAPALAELNNIDRRTKLRPGQKLLVSSQSTFISTDLIDTRRKIVYTVRKGDTLAKVSKRYDVSEPQLRKWNNIKKKRPRLHAGQRLIVYVDMLADAKRGE